MKLTLLMSEINKSNRCQKGSKNPKICRRTGQIGRFEFEEIKAYGNVNLFYSCNNNQPRTIYQRSHYRVQSRYKKAQGAILPKMNCFLIVALHRQHELSKFRPTRRTREKENRKKM